MAGVHGGADPGAQPEPRWDVALSFASAQRDYVGQVAGTLKARGVRGFYDGDEVVELWGKDLAEELYRFKTNRMASDLVFMRSATPPGSTR